VDPLAGQELDGRLLQPSNHHASEPDLLDVFPYTDRIVDLASVDLARVSDGANPISIEISHPWPPNEANILEPATWRLELLVCGDNIRLERSFVTLSFDGNLAAGGVREPRDLGALPRPRPAR
jgi:hypothetical protein